MTIKAILFDLDGTLLPMDQDKFIGAYAKALAMRMMQKGYEPKKFIDSLWAGVGAMVKNDGSCMNHDAFWKAFCAIHGEKVMEDKPFVEEFYRIEFNQIQASCGYTQKSKELIDELKGTGVKIVLATNPLFPEMATAHRIRWAGLAPEDFELFTTYDNSRFCKPNLKYYLEILEKIGCKPEECIMVGNDVSEDMIAEQLGMKVFLLTDCIINKEEKDINLYPHGSFEELRAFLLARIS